MSTKVYGAFKINKSIDWTFDFLHSLRLDIHNIIMEDLYKNSAKQVCDIIDSNTFYKGYSLDYEIKQSFEYYKGKAQTLIEHVMKTLIGYGKLSYNSQQRLSNGYDYSASCVIIKYKKNQTILKFFIENDNVNKHIEKKLQEFGGVDFHYQNSTDRPEDISNYEWKKRKLFWDKMGKFGTFKEMGYTFELGLKEYTFSYPDEEKYKILKEKIMEYIPLVEEERISDIAWDKFPRYYTEEILKQPKKENETEDEMYERIEKFYIVKKWVKNSEEGKNIFNEFVDKNIKPNLIKITEEELKKEYKLNDNYYLIVENQ